MGKKNLAQPPIGKSTGHGIMRVSAAVGATPQYSVSDNYTIRPQSQMFVMQSIKDFN